MKLRSFRSIRLLQNNGELAEWLHFLLFLLDFQIKPLGVIENVQNFDCKFKAIFEQVSLQL